MANKAIKDEVMRVECYTPAMCENKRVEASNTAVSVQFDKVTSVRQFNQCECVEKQE